jgi:hypothetical protein
MSCKRGNDNFGDRNTVAMAHCRVKIATEIHQNSPKFDPPALVSFRRRKTPHRMHVDSYFPKLHLTSYRIACLVFMFDHVFGRDPV